MIKTFWYKNMEVSYFEHNCNSNKNLIIIPNLFKSYYDYRHIIQNYMFDYNIFSLNINLLHLNKTEINFAQTSFLIELFEEFINIININKISIIAHSFGSSLILYNLKKLNDKLDKIIIWGPITNYFMNINNDFTNFYKLSKKSHYEDLYNFSYIYPHVLTINSKNINKMHAYLKENRLKLNTKFKINFLKFSNDSENLLIKNLKSFNKNLYYFYILEDDFYLDYGYNLLFKKFVKNCYIKEIDFKDPLYAKSWLKDYDIETSKILLEKKWNY
ncbi:Uncharacterised protein [Mycoplasmopsis maculosa]|uniref:Alpha/beta hydrolase n=1 Tax=Mycoplasmopsis maculosa TaxID=114885 RepID=A0A449B5D2_9BACT|nr:alpha/beta hydrolase [Mycoplasmopsis maculosa]VEU75813.1 Uncharacterised protein [Mycoplasmopsis maculosa]